MKQAFLVSFGFHLAMALLLALPLLQLSRRMPVSPAYHVALVELPAPPIVAPPAPPPPPEKPAPPRVPDKPPPIKPVKIPEPVKPAPKPKAPTPPAPPVAKPEPPPVAKPEPAPPVETPAPPAAAVPSVVVPTVDAPTFCSDYPEYCSAFQRKLESQWIPPPRPGNEPMQAIVVFRVQRDGAVSGIVLEASSGNFYFDQAVQRAVLLAAPFPPLPHTFDRDTLKWTVPFTGLPSQ